MKEFQPVPPEQSLSILVQIKEGIVELTQLVPLQRSQEGIEDQIVDFLLLPLRGGNRDVSALQFRKEIVEVITAFRKSAFQSALLTKSSMRQCPRLFRKSAVQSAPLNKSTSSRHRPREISVKWCRALSWSASRWRQWHSLRLRSTRKFRRSSSFRKNGCSNAPWNLSSPSMPQDTEEISEVVQSFFQGGISECFDVPVPSSWRGWFQQNGCVNGPLS